MRMFIFLLVLLGFSAIHAQIVVTEDDEMNQPLAVHKNESGFSIALASNGIGIGGFYRFAMPKFFYAGLNLEFFFLRDDKEAEVFDPFTGRVFKLNDVNRLFTIPINVELKKRIFSSSIENNFRPHFFAQTGTVFGMNFPNEVLIDNEIVRKDNEYETSLDGVLGLGVDFSTRENYFATIRVQYRHILFQNMIADKRNHSAFEIKFEIGGLR